MAALSLTLLLCDFFALPFENFQSQQKEKMDLIEIRGFTNGIEQVGDYRVGYISGKLLINSTKYKQQ